MSRSHVIGSVVLVHRRHLGHKGRIVATHAEIGVRIGVLYHVADLLGVAARAPKLSVETVGVWDVENTLGLRKS